MSLAISAGLPLEELATSPAARGTAMEIEAEGPVILYEGRLEPSKDVRTLIRALPGVFAAHREAVCVVRERFGAAEPPG